MLARAYLTLLSAVAVEDPYAATEAKRQAKASALYSQVNKLRAPVELEAESANEPIPEPSDPPLPDVGPLQFACNAYPPSLLAC